MPPLFDYCNRQEQSITIDSPCQALLSIPIDGFQK